MTTSPSDAVADLDLPDLTFTAPCHVTGEPITWSAYGTQTQGPERTRVNFARLTTQDTQATSDTRPGRFTVTNPRSGASITASFTPAGLTLQPGSTHWTGTTVTPAAQPLLHTPSVVLHLLRSERLGTTRHTAYDDTLARAGKANPSGAQRRRKRALLDLLIATYELADPASRATALAALAAGYTGTAQDLLTAVRTATS